MDRTNIEEVKKSVLCLVLEKYTGMKSLEIYVEFMKNYELQLKDDIFNKPRRSYKHNMLDKVYPRQYPNGPTESEMLPFMGYALLHFEDNWVTNWLNSFYDSKGNLLKHFSPIVN